MLNGCCVGEITNRFPLAWYVHIVPPNVWLSVFVLGLAHCEILFVSMEYIIHLWNLYGYIMSYNSVDMPDA